jgi:hypothetical protein
MLPAEMFGGLKKEVCFLVPIFGAGEAACRHGFMLCGTESIKIISAWYKSYGLVDSYQFLHIKFVLPA